MEISCSGCGKRVPVPEAYRDRIRKKIEAGKPVFGHGACKRMYFSRLRELDIMDAHGEGPTVSPYEIETAGEK